MRRAPNKLFKCLLSVLLLVYIPSAPVFAQREVIVVPSDKDELCAQAFSNYDQIRKELVNKCNGATRDSCIAAAQECNNSGDSSSSSGWGAISSILSNAVMPTFGGGMMAPMAGAPGSQGFSCLTKDSRKDLKEQMETIRKEAVDGEKEARDYQRDIQRESKDIRKEMADLKKEFYEKVAASKKASVAIGKDITRARENAKEQAREILRKLDSNEKQKANLLGEQEMLEAQAQSLYPDTVGTCADKMATSKNKLVNEFFEIRQRMQDEMAKISDLRERERVRQRYNRQVVEKESLYKEQLRLEYDGCLKAETRRYQAGYKSIQATLAAKAREVATIEKENQMLNQQLADIPNILSQEIEGLQKDLSSEQQLALQNLQTMDQQIKESVADYQSRYLEAQQSYAKAAQKLNAEQMKDSQRQAMFQMNTFGDAASILEEVDEAKKLVCDRCRGSKRTGDWCDRSSDSGSGSQR